MVDVTIDVIAEPETTLIAPAVPVDIIEIFAVAFVAETVSRVSWLLLIIVDTVVLVVAVFALSEVMSSLFGLLALPVVFITDAAVIAASVIPPVMCAVVDGIVATGVLDTMVELLLTNLDLLLTAAGMNLVIFAAGVTSAATDINDSIGVIAAIVASVV